MVPAWVKLCDLIVTHGPYLSAFIVIKFISDKRNKEMKKDIKSFYKALYKFICLLTYFKSFWSCFSRQTNSGVYSPLASGRISNTSELNERDFIIRNIYKDIY